MNSLQTIAGAPDEEPARQVTGMGAMSVEQQRAIAETQAAMFVAKQFPRDLKSVLLAIGRTCSRKSVAEIAAYSYKRGTEEITGPSVYLLKAIAQEWGNLTFGVRVLSTTNGTPGVPGASTVEAFAWDMERNVRETRVFDVKHWRDTGGGGYALKTERDVYELIANMGSRRLRACLEGIIPEDVKNYAVAACDNALLDAKIDTPEQRAELLQGFLDVGVTKEMIEARLNKKFESATPNQLLKLLRGLTAIRDGVTTAAEAFPPPPAEKSETKGVEGLKARIQREPGED